MGGRRQGAVATAITECNPPQTADELHALIAQVIVEVRAGKVDSKVGNAVACLGTLFLKTFDATAIERRLCAVEEQLGRGVRPQWTA